MEDILMQAKVQGMILGFKITLYLFFMFQLKHFLVDFLVQNRYPYMWMNKGKLLHPGGWLHAGSHGLSSFLMLVKFSIVGSVPLFFLVSLCLGETLVHYTIDYCKTNIVASQGWKCNTSPYFWDILGVDQFLHQLTYLGMILLWAS